MPVDLRYYQHNALEWILNRATKRHDARLLVVLPSGGGKTIIAATLLKLTVGRRKEVRGMFVAHRAELFEQMATACNSVGISPENIARIGSSNDATKLFFATAADVRRGESLPVVDVVITDESHRDAGPYRRAFRAHYNNVLRVGFTATPERLDGRSLKDDFDDMFVAAQPSELIANGHIVAPRVFTVGASMLPNMRSARIRAGEFAKDDMNIATASPIIIGGVIEHWIKRAERRKTMVFACSIAHAGRLVDEFNRVGITARQLDGSTPKKMRESTLHDFKNGRYDILISCDLLSEGIDIPDVKCVVMARPTASAVVCNQQAGRCMRVVPGDTRSALILDHAGNIIRHGYPYADRDWSLDDVKARRTRQVLVVCQTCHAVVERGALCASCGQRMPTQSRVCLDLPTEVTGELLSFAEAVSDKVRRRDFDKLRELAHKRGFGEQWAMSVFEAKYGIQAQV